MYTIIRRYQLAPGADQHEVVRLVRESYLPLVTSAPGFISYAIIAFGQMGICSISTFTDQAAAEAAAQQSAAWVLRTVVQYLAGPPEITAGEVRIAAGSLPAV
jgi:hypothetical protein